MKRIVALLAAVWAWIRSWFVRQPRPLKTIHAEELPETIDPQAVYVLGEGKHVWFIAMTCPCGCRATLQMSLLPDAKPQWRLTEHLDDGTITLHPSVWRRVGCQSHFYLRRGLIQWCQGAVATEPTTARTILIQ